MARKSLLTESEIRSFMKLAELRPLGDDRIAEMYGTDELSEEDELERELDATEDELGAEDSLADEEADEIDDMDADMAMEPAMDAEGGADMVSIDDFMGALEDALEDVLGQPVSTEMDDDDDGDVEMDMDMDIDGVEDEVDVAMDAEEDEMPGMRDIYENEEAIVNEVARRVAARLQEKDSQQQMVDALAERIMKRLTK